MRGQLREILQQAQKKHFAVPQFNFCTIAQLKGIIEVAKRLKRPFILGTSEGESRYLGLNLVIGIKRVIERESGLKVFLNLDHGKSFEYLKKAIDAGYQMVHFDGSEMEIEKNIVITKKVVAYGKKRGVVVEGELGYIPGSSKIHKRKPKITPEIMTQPDQAKRFVKETGVDALAISIGNVHGIFNKGGFNLDLKRLSMIKKQIGEGVFLVLHGGSGIPSDQIKEAIKRGIVKINVSTEIRRAWRLGIESSFRANPEQLSPYKIMSQAIRRIEKVVEKKMKLFYSISD